MHAPGDERGALSWEIAQTATRQALRRWPRCRPYREDILSDACLGVTLARNSFDPDRGVAFMTYALYRARGQILDGLRHRAPLTRGELAQGVEPPLEPRSLDATSPTGQTLADLIPDQRRPYEDDVCNDDALHRILLLLPLQQAAVLCAYDLSGDTLAEFGARMGYTESRACQLRREALENARRIA